MIWSFVCKVLWNRMWEDHFPFFILTSRELWKYLICFPPFPNTGSGLISFLTHFIYAQAFGHSSIDPSDGNTTENISKTFIKTLQGDALNSLTEAMMENLQLVIRAPVVPKSQMPAWVTEGMYSFCYRVMFEAGYLTLFGRDRSFRLFMLQFPTLKQWC